MKPQQALPCLFLPHDGPDTLDDALPVIWSEDGRDSVGPLGERLRALRGQPFVLVLPVERVTFCAVHLPAGRSAWRTRAIPFAVEPFLAEDVESLHLAIGARMIDGRHRVAAIRRRLLEDWTGYFRAAGAEPAAIHVDADLLPGGRASVYWSARRCLLGGDASTRLAFPPSLWPLVAADCAPPYTVHHHPGEPPPAEAGLSEHLARLSLPLHAWLAQRRDQAVDLAQGVFGRRPQRRPEHWRLPLLAVAAVVLAQLAFDAGQAWLLRQQAAAYTRVNEGIYRSLFPTEQRIVDLRAQFDRHLAAGLGTSRFLELLQAVSAHAPGDGALQLRQLEYSAARGAMQLTADPSHAAALEDLGDRLRADGFRVQADDGRNDAPGLVVGGGP